MFRCQPLRRFRPGKLQAAGISTVPTNVKQKTPVPSVTSTSSVPATTSTTSSSSTLPTTKDGTSVSSLKNDDAAKRKQKKTSARLRPRFENLQYMFGSAVVALVTIGLQHYVRKGWDRLKGNRNERDLMAALAEKFEVRQDWSVAVLYSAVRQADRKMFVNSSPSLAASTPSKAAADADSPEQKQEQKKKQNEKFGAPFLADPQFEEQIDFLDGFLTKLRNEQFPTISMPDMWVAATLTALRSLGGPSINVTFGRGNSTTDDNLYNPSEKSFHVAPPLADQISCIEFSEPYVANGFSTPEIVALQGVRSLACHGDSSSEQMARLTATVEARETNRAPVQLPDAPKQVWGATSCGVLNFFFFSNLLEGQWEEKTKTATRFVAEKVGGANNNKNNGGDGILGWWNSLFGGKEVSSSNVISKANLDDDEAALVKYVPKKMVVSYYEDATNPMLCMEPRDLELLEDAYFAGWIHKFGQNEVEFLRVFAEALVKTTQLGWRDTVFNEVAWW